MKTFVLDSSALMTFFEDRPGAGVVEKLLEEAAKARQSLLLSVINWGEIYYSLWRLHGEEAAGKTLEQISELPIAVADIDAASTLLAARLKAVQRLPYVDCFAAALAIQRKATLVTSDRDFARIEKLAAVLWLA